MRTALSKDQQPTEDVLLQVMKSQFIVQAPDGGLSELCSTPARSLRPVSPRAKILFGLPLKAGVLGIAKELIAGCAKKCKVVTTGVYQASRFNSILVQ